MLQIDIYILLAQIINFGILFYIFKKFIADKLNAWLEERKKQLDKLKTAEEHYEQKMSLAKQQKQEMIDAARETSAALMKETEIISKEKAQKIIEKAHVQSDSILEWGKREIEKERLSMLAQMKNHIMDVSLRLNEKMFDSESANKEFLEKELESLK